MKVDWQNRMQIWLTFVLKAIAVFGNHNFCYIICLYYLFAPAYTFYQELWWLFVYIHLYMEDPI